MRNVIPVMLLTLAVALHAGAQPAVSAPASPPVGATNTLAPSPKIRFLEPIHDFGRVQMGQTVKCDFVFTNMGDATLEIIDVHPSCGCTTTGEFDRKVEPGKTGKIAVQFIPNNVNGDVSKVITVACNDRTSPTVIVQLRAHVWRPVLMEPSFAVFSLFGPPTTNDVKTFKITNNLPEPLLIQSVEISSRLFSAQLLTNQPGREYLVNVRPSGPVPPGSSQATLTVKPASTNTLPLTAIIVASLQEPIVILPSQLTIPGGPLEQNVTKSFLIRNVLFNPIVLSNAVINLPNVDVQLAENHPGHLFTVTVTFPSGFKLGPGRDAFISVQSSYPRRPVIKVPVVPEVSAGAPLAPPSPSSQASNP
jgi:hypothetical protein